MSFSYSNSINAAPVAENFTAHAQQVRELYQGSPTALKTGARSISDIAIVGAGNAAQSLACFFAKNGYSPYLLVRSPQKVAGLMERRTINCVGKLEGKFEIAQVSQDFSAALKHCKTIFVATTTGAYGEVAESLAPFLTPEHEIVLFSSKFLGVVEFKNALKFTADQLPSIVETDTIFASRIQPDESLWIRGVKNWTLYSSWNCSETRKTSAIISRFFPNLGEAENVVQRGLTDFGALAHPITMIANMNAVDRNDGFLFYYDGFTERTIVLIERLEDEFHALARAYHTSIMPMKKLLNEYYGCRTTSLLDAMRSVPNYSVSQAPGTLQHRFIEEDVASSLVPMQQLARKASIKTPVIDSIINIASVLLAREFAEEGRTLFKLGWAHMSHEEILQSIHA